MEPEFDAPIEDEVPTTLNIAGLLEQDYNELAENVDVYIRVKGYDASGLQVHYRLPENGKELDNIARKVNREYKDTFSRNLYSAIDTMITLCEGLYVQPDGVEEPVMLDLEGLGAPCRFDERFAKNLGMKDANEASARQVVRRMFNSQDLMIIAHAEKLSRWLSDTKADLDVEFWQLGE